MPTASLFQPLIATIWNVSAAISSSENWASTWPNTSSGAPVCGSSVSASHRQRCPLAQAVERRLAPGREDVQPLLVLAPGPSVLAVHVEAVGAAVELGGAQLDELQQRRLEVGAPNCL